MLLADVVAATTAVGATRKRLKKRATLSALLRQAQPEEIEPLIGMLIGDPRQGALGTGWAGVAAVDPSDAIANAAEGTRGLTAVRLQPLRAVQPMLATTADTAGAAIAELGRCSVEWKLDGIRIQLHRSGNDVAIFTPNLNNVTTRLPGVVGLARSLPAERFVLDGVDLIDVGLEDRMAALTGLVGKLAIPGVITDDPAEADARFPHAVEAGHEGVMVKAADSPYEAGRRGNNWRKVKPVYTFDLVVLAAEWGHGRRQGWLSNLHLGARASDGSLVMVGKTFKGLTDKMPTSQTGILQSLGVTAEGITLWVRPELVVEVALDGVQRSTRYPGGLALRLARVKRHRTDKSVEDIDRLETLQVLL